MDIKEAYQTMQEASGIKKGDKVRCLRHFKDNEMGSSSWDSKYTGQKAAFVDSKAIGIVSNTIVSRSISVTYGAEGRHGTFPFFVLEVVEPAKEEKMITVDGQEYSESTLATAVSALTAAIKEYVG